MDETLTSITTLGQIKPRSNGNKDVVYTHRSSRYSSNKGHTG